MPSQEVHVEGFDAFKSKVEELTAAKKTVIVLFSGSKNDKGICAYSIVLDGLAQ